MIYERIKELCKARGITVAKLEKDLELGRSSVRKFDQHDPGVGKMNMIAGYLGVTLNDLILLRSRPVITKPLRHVECSYYRASGVNLRTLQDYEQDRKQISQAAAVTVHKIAKALGVTVEELIQ